MGFNKRIISESLVNELNENPSFHETLKKYDAFIFETEEVKRKFKLLENGYFEKKVVEQIKK